MTLETSRLGLNCWRSESNRRIRVLQTLERHIDDRTCGPLSGYLSGLAECEVGAHPDEDRGWILPPSFGTAPQISTGFVESLCYPRSDQTRASNIRLACRPLGYEPRLKASPGNPGAPTPFNSRNRVTPSYLEPRVDRHTNGHTQRPIPCLSRPPPSLLRLQLDLFGVLHDGGLMEAVLPESRDRLNCENRRTDPTRMAQFGHWSGRDPVPPDLASARRPWP